MTQRTVRYYESRGLIPRGIREGAGQHHYPEQTIARLIKIDQLKKLGLSLEEIAGVIDLYFSDPSGERAKKQVLSMLQRHLVDAEARIETLLAVRDDLKGHILRFEQWFKEQRAKG